METVNKECRICFDDEDQETIISPCLCKGTMKWIHRDCLIKTLDNSDIVCCKICSFQYDYTSSIIIDRQHLKSTFYKYTRELVIRLCVLNLIGVPLICLYERSTMNLFTGKGALLFISIQFVPNAIVCGILSHFDTKRIRKRIYNF